MAIYILLGVLCLIALALRAFIIVGSLFWSLYRWDRWSLTFTVLRFWVWDSAKLIYYARPYSERKPGDTFEGWLEKQCWSKTYSNKKH